MSNIAEFFGFAPNDSSPAASQARKNLYCPFQDRTCTKLLHGSEPSGVCSLHTPKWGDVIICPVRLYADGYKVLQDVARDAFGEDVRLIQGHDLESRKKDGNDVAVFGHGWGRELRLPQRQGTGSYFVDWILALLDPTGALEQFVAVEVQTIDTTGNYQAERMAYLNGEDFAGKSTANLNWENVFKRILRQLIYKGQVLRREPLCYEGLYFVCPSQVFENIQRGLGSLEEYEPHPGSLTFRWYSLEGPALPGASRNLTFEGTFTTTTEQVAAALAVTRDLPPARVYERAVRSQLGEISS